MPGLKLVLWLSSIGLSSAFLQAPQLLSPSAPSPVARQPLSPLALSPRLPPRPTLRPSALSPSASRITCTATDPVQTIDHTIAGWEAEYQALKLDESKAKNEESGVFGMLGSAFSKATGGDDVVNRVKMETKAVKEGPRADDPPILDSYRVVAEFPHTKESFTQGLHWSGDGKSYYEGSGGASFSHGTRIAKVDLSSGETLRYRDLPSRHFGEGVVTLGSKLYQLTWRSGLGFIYDKDSFKLLGQWKYQYDHEGWGFTTDGEELIMSDGSATLHFLDPESLETKRQLIVRYLGRKSGEMTPLRRLNDLQWIKGKIYANIWEVDRIAVIDPESGFVERFIEMKGLLNDQDPWIKKWSKSDRCLNGIFFDEKEDRLYVSGKMWTKIYEIEVLEGEGDEEAKKAAPRTDYYDSAGGFDPLGMGM